MAAFDPELNPGKTLEETLNNFITWIRNSNRGTASLLRSINDKLGDISKREENLKSLEASQIKLMDQINKVIDNSTTTSDQSDSQGDIADFNKEFRLLVVGVINQLKDLAKSTVTTQEIIEMEFTHSMDKIEGAVLDIKSDIMLINSQLKIPPKKVESKPIRRDVKRGIERIQQQIICKTEQDKATVLKIIDEMIANLLDVKVEISGLDVKKRLIMARTQVYDQTEGLAPRFRKMMDNLMEAINDQSLYSSGTLEPLLIEGIRHIREIYHSAPVG